MGTPAHHRRYTLDDYLSFERGSNAKHEYLDGEIYAMAGGSFEHSALAAQLIFQVQGHLQRTPCRTLTSDMRVRIPETGLDTYPDVTVVCGPPRIDAKDEHAINNPTVLVEITSPSSEDYDRGDKFEHYQRLESLKQYVVVAHAQRKVDVWTRIGSEWKLQTFGAGEIAEFDAIGAKVNVDELYAAADAA